MPLRLGRSALHRRRNSIATDYDDRCLPCAVALLLPAGDEHMRASLQIGLTASDKVDDFGVARDDNGLPSLHRGGVRCIFRVRAPSSCQCLRKCRANFSIIMHQGSI